MGVHEPQRQTRLRIRRDLAFETIQNFFAVHGAVIIRDRYDGAFAENTEADVKGVLVGHGLIFPGRGAGAGVACNALAFAHVFAIPARCVDHGVGREFFEHKAHHGRCAAFNQQIAGHVADGVVFLGRRDAADVEVIGVQFLFRQAPVQTMDVRNGQRLRYGAREVLLDSEDFLR